MRDKDPDTAPAAGRRIAPADIEKAVRATRAFLKAVLSLVGVGVFLFLEFGTRLADQFGGTPKQKAFAMIMVCAVPLMIAYFPLAWWLSALVRRRLR